jgi:hypothetical protein
LFLNSAFLYKIDHSTARQYLVAKSVRLAAWFYLWLEFGPNLSDFAKSGSITDMEESDDVEPSRPLNIFSPPNGPDPNFPSQKNISSNNLCISSMLSGPFSCYDPTVIYKNTINSFNLNKIYHNDNNVVVLSVVTIRFR